MMLIQALKFMNLNGIDQKFNLKLVMDFEEEKSSPSLPYAVKKYSELLESDALLIFDGPQHQSNLPTLNFGNRGISSITLKTYGPIVPQHSGHFGNYAPNPIFRMSEILNSMKDENGRVTINGFYDGIDIDKKTLEVLSEVPDDEVKMRENMQFKIPDDVASSYQESIQFPSLNVRGIESGWVGDEVRTIIPAECIAEIDVRLVIESDGLSEEAASELCRTQGIFPHHLKEWKQQFITGSAVLADTKKQVTIKSLRNEIKDLNKDLNRKNKALAETAALLVLKKKVDEIWGKSEDSLQ